MRQLDSQLNIGLRRTHRLTQGKLGAIRKNSANILKELDSEVKERLPSLRKTIEESESYEQASLQIQREAHSAPDSFKDFFKAIFMWRDNPEENLRREE